MHWNEMKWNIKCINNSKQQFYLKTENNSKKRCTCPTKPYCVQKYHCYYYYCRRFFVLIFSLILLALFMFVFFLYFMLLFRISNIFTLFVYSLLLSFETNFNDPFFSCEHRKYFQSLFVYNFYERPIFIPASISTISYSFNLSKIGR